MNFFQLHERLRLELRRRIEREVMTASLLARKTGLQQPHISNFVHSKRRFSIQTLDRVLAALELSVADLIDPRADAREDARPAATAAEFIPLVSPEAATYDDRIRPSSIRERVQLPSAVLASLRAEHGARTPVRERFVAISLTPAQAAPMYPVLRAAAIVVLDRHSNTPAASSASSRPIYAVRFGKQLQFCYLSFDRNHLVLRPHSLDFPIQLLPVPLQTAPSDLVIGRVCYALLTL